MSPKSVLHVCIALSSMWLLLIMFYPETEHPSDDQLIQRFHRYEADFNTPLAMSNEDPQADRIAPDWPEASKLGISEQRLSEYRRRSGGLACPPASGDGTI